MGAPKGKPHRKFTQEEKLAYIAEFQEAHVSQSKFAKEHGLYSGRKATPVPFSKSLTTAIMLLISVRHFNCWLCVLARALSFW